MAKKFELDSWVWVPDELERYIPAKVVSSFFKGEAAVLLTEDGEELKVSTALSNQLLECNSEALDSSIGDLVNISDLNEMSILHNLRIRYKQDMIYTNVSSILISVNPFKLLPLYTPAILDSYRQGIRDKPPHVFAIAHNAYSGMIDYAADQSVIISGESGAGKSEATKLILQFLTDVSSHTGSGSGSINAAPEAGAPVTPVNPTGYTSRRKSITGGGGGHLEQQILAANPILEAFGNAKTLRNNNSSRFGKLITVDFDSNGSIIGGRIINYLLEKSRVVGQSKGERNYHVFYQLLAAGDADEELQERLKLQDAELFHYTGQSGVIHIEGVSDEKDYEEVMNSMSILNFTEAEKSNILRVIAAVLHLGNIKFVAEKRANEEDAGAIGNPEVAEYAAELLGLAPEVMKKSILSKNIGPREVVLVRYTPTQAQDARDALVKRVYAELFQYVVNRINAALQSKANTVTRHKFIGVLDIFGFESFTTNSFEQLCINYCNEKLQFHFNEHIFRMEQTLYAAEGVNISSTDFQDNKPTLDLLEAKATGIFSMCDEEISVPKGSDEGMLQKIYQKHADGKHPNCIRPKPKDCVNSMKCFGVQHYAGPVFYDVSGFLDKNRDQVHADILGGLRTSNNALVQALFESTDPAADKGGARVGGKAATAKTLGAQFKSQLTDLVNTLNATHPHFVRCIKPNDVRAGNQFVSVRVQDQLRYAGLVEVCRIRKLGYPDRRDFDTFYKRYKCIDTTAGNLDNLLANLTARGILVPGEFAKGKTRVFMRTAQVVSLEIAREAVFVKVAVVVQKVARSYLSRRRFKVWIRTLQNVKDAMGTRDEKSLSYAIDMSFELPFGGAHIQVIKDAKALLARVREENRVLVLLQNAVKNRDINAIRNALAAAASMKPAFVHAIISEAETLLARLVEEMNLKADLVKAISSRSIATLNELLSKARSMGLECDEVNQAAALKARLEEEERAINALKQAMANKVMSELSECIARCAELGIDNSDVASARALQGQLEAEATAVMNVRAAVEARQLPGLIAALEKVASLGISNSVPDVAAGYVLKATLEKEKAAEEGLIRATNARSLADIEAALAVAIAAGLQSSDAVLSANKMKEQLQTEVRIRSALASATASSDLEQIGAALAEADKVGLRGPEVEAARNKIKESGAQNAIRDKLRSVAAGDSLEAIDAAIKDAKSAGLDNAPEMASVLSRRARLLEAQAEIDKLVAATSAASLESFQTLSRVLDDCIRMELQSRYPNQIAAAQAKCEYLKEEKEFQGLFTQAADAADLAQISALLAKAAAKGLKESVSFGEKAKSEVGRRDEILKSISSALESKDKGRVQALLIEADSIELTGERVHQARLFADREKLVESTLTSIRKAEKEWDITLLNSALKSAIELGVSSSDIERAEKLRSVLQVVEDARGRIASCIQVLAVQAKTGLDTSDLKSLSLALADAKKIEKVPPKWQVIDDATAALELYQKHVEARKGLIAALASPSTANVQEALAKAEDLKMEIPEVASGKAYLKTAGVGTSNATFTTNLDSNLEYEEAEKQRMIRREIARQARFELKNFYGLRTPDDFAKGIFLNKQKVKSSFLIWQDAPVKMSLCDLNSDLSKIACQIHKDLMGYMGDKQMPFPAMLAQDILQKGFTIPGLRDEIYVQIIKQLTENPRAESVAKGWQILCMCVATFAPSQDFENFLMHYIVFKMEHGRGAIVDYAKYCLRSLEGILASGESCGFVPSIEEIQAYKDRPPILATIELVDGQVIAQNLPVTPDLNVGKVLEITFGWMNLTDPRMSSLGIFVYDLGELVEVHPERRESILLGEPHRRNSLVGGAVDLPRTPRPLRNEDFLGDVIVQKTRQKRGFKFVLKKKIFMPSHNVRGFDGLIDPYYERLTYIQAEDDIIINGLLQPSNENEAVFLATASIMVAFGAEAPNTVEGLMGINVVDFIPPSFRYAHLAEDWCKRIIVEEKKFVGMTPEDIQYSFMQVAQKHPYYGMHWFYVQKLNENNDVMMALPAQFILGFNSSGMHVFDMQRDLLRSFSYPDIYRWGGSSSQFSMVIAVGEGDETIEMVVSTCQAADMAAIILDQIHAIMAEEGLSA